MAARNRTWTPDVVRQRIRVQELVNRLEAFALGTKLNGQVVVLTPDRIKAIEVLLRKTLPDLSTTELKTAPPPAVAPIICIGFANGGPGAPITK